MTSMKDDRLQLRVDATSKRRLEEAAAEAHLSVTAFVLQAASRAADNLLAQRQTIRLSPDSAAVFTEALTLSLIHIFATDLPNRKTRFPQPIALGV